MAELNPNVTVYNIMDTLDRDNPEWMAGMLDIVRGNELVGKTPEQQAVFLRGRMSKYVDQIARATYATMLG